MSSPPTPPEGYRLAERGETHPFDSGNNYTTCYILVEHAKGSWWARWHGINPEDWEPWDDGSPVSFAIPLQGPRIASVTS